MTHKVAYTKLHQHSSLTQSKHIHRSWLYAAQPANAKRHHDFSVCSVPPSQVVGTKRTGMWSHPHAHTYMYIHAHVYMHKHTHIHTRVHTHIAFALKLHAYGHTYIHNPVLLLTTPHCLAQRTHTHTYAHAQTPSLHQSRPLLLSCSKRASFRPAHQARSKGAPTAAYTTLSRAAAAAAAAAAACKQKGRCLP